MSEVAWPIARYAGGCTKGTREVRLAVGLCWLLVFSFVFFPSHHCRAVVFYLLDSRANNVIKRVWWCVPETDDV